MTRRRILIHFEYGSEKNIELNMKIRGRDLMDIVIFFIHEHSGWYE